MAHYPGLSLRATREGRRSNPNKDISLSSQAPFQGLKTMRRILLASSNCVLDQLYHKESFLGRSRGTHPADIRVSATMVHASLSLWSITTGAEPPETHPSSPLLYENHTPCPPEALHRRVSSKSGVSESRSLR